MYNNNQFFLNSEKEVETAKILKGVSNILNSAPDQNIILTLLCKTYSLYIFKNIYTPQLRIP